ncbi:MAG TPA: hypothetical protein VGG62_00520 [Terracidiphilus sp.]
MKTQIKSAQLLLIILVATAAFGGFRAACAQAPGTTSSASQAPGVVATGQPKGLFINIIEGEGALNDIRTRTAREPIVEVDDENHKPVAGALVLFAIDNGGSSSPFASFSGANTVSVTTDEDGRAVGRGFQVTQHKGQYKINVRATKGELQADSVILQTNIEVLVSPSGGSTTAAVVAHHHWGWIIGGVAVAGGVVGVVIATHGSSSPTTVTPGTGTVGAPAAVGGVRIPLHGHAR